MKNITKTLPALALATLMIAGSASAASITDILTPVNTSSVILTVDNGVATLTGDVESVGEKSSLERAVMDLEGVEEVNSFLSF